VANGPNIFQMLLVFTEKPLPRLYTACSAVLASGMIDRLSLYGDVCTQSLCVPVFVP